MTPERDPAPGSGAPTGLARAALVVALAGGFLLGAPTRPAAHEIPTDVALQVFVKPEGERLRFLVRAPLEAMRDIEFPLRGPGYLDLENAGPRLRDAAQLWIADYVEIFEDGRRLEDGELVAARVSLPSDGSFGSYDEAVAHMTGPPLPADTELFWQQGMLDVLIEYPIVADSSEFALRPELAHLGMRTTTSLRFLPPDGGVRAFQYRGNPGRVQLDPDWHQAALRFVESGVHHIMGGIDHLLFLLCLVIPFRSLWGLVPIVTSFTVAHSITLVGSALGMAPEAAWFPPLIETLIALSIVYMAFENIVGARLERRWLITFGFGLVHGFGFSFFLSEQLQFAGTHLLTSLLAFNAGVEVGQLLVLALVIPVLHLLFRYAVPERMGTILLSALVAHSAWHWMGERWTELRQFPVRWPGMDAAFAANAMQWAMMLLVLGGVMWALYELFDRTPAGSATPPAGD